MRWSSHLRGLLDESRSRGWRFEPTAAMGPELLYGVVPCGRVQARHDDPKIERSTNNLSAAKRIVQGLSGKGTPSDYFELRAALALPRHPSSTGLDRGAAFDLCTGIPVVRMSTVRLVVTSVFSRGMAGQLEGQGACFLLNTKYN
jgi:hypothetical protein